MSTSTDQSESGVLTRIAICSSSRFYESARRTAERLSGEGVIVFTPSFEHDETQVSVDTETKAFLTHSFLEKISAADAVYVIAEDGYIGRSVALEIGYATALGKPVFLSEEADEDAIKALTTDIVAVHEASGARLASLDSCMPQAL